MIQNGMTEQEQMNMEKKEMAPQMLEELLQEAYSTEPVPEEVNVRLKNQLMCRQAAQGQGVSFWWLPATLNTIISIAAGAILYLAYVIINIKGANSWMPNLLQLLSELWLKGCLAVIGFEMAVSWLVTILGTWKGNLFRSARIF